MKTEELFRIWDRFEKSEADEILFEDNEVKFKLKKNTLNNPNFQQVKFSDAMSNCKDEKQESRQDNAAGDDGKYIVKAPFVGTFYSSPSPGEAPFVNIGTKVKKGDVIGIIEAMKLMNEITAPNDGVITGIFIEDETLVEYDQPLMSIGE